MIGVIISLLVTVLMVRVLLKHYKPQFVLFVSGLIMLFAANVLDLMGLLPGGLHILPKKRSPRASWALTPLRPSPRSSLRVWQALA